jgi:hypothetical protein
MQAVLFRGANVMLVWHELGAIFILGLVYFAAAHH